MDSPRAIELLRSLADGRDPFTGQPFPADSPYQQADTVRALYLAIEALKSPAARQKDAPDPNRPTAGQKWTPEEEQRLRAAFASNPSIPDLAAAHGRTRGAISSRLVKLGLIEPPAHALFPPTPAPLPNETIIPTQSPGDPSTHDLKDLPF